MTLFEYNICCTLFILLFSKRMSISSSLTGSRGQKRVAPVLGHTIGVMLHFVSYKS